MKLSLRVMTIDTPEQTGNDEMFEREVCPEEAFVFLSRLISPQIIIYLEAPHGSLDFWKHEDSLWVELYTDALWATSKSK